MASKKKVVYEEGVLNWTMKGQKWINNQLNFLIECPFCKTRAMIQANSMAANGQKCKKGKCGAKHYMSGHSARNFVPGSQMPVDQMPTDLSRTALGMPMYKDGTPLAAIVRDGWSRGFDASQTVEEAKVMGFNQTTEEYVLEKWVELDLEMEESLADNGGAETGEIRLDEPTPGQT